ncbi:hypothetical protein ACFO0N_16285 [Halobium salinum]|uniref:Uncharacterized protein n=1 Tax=Halobium salinum TaxID=1364940 RepID=A0ABD5PFQ1_9EURY|nr:hypothetical protein [Halobium salinum]
MSSPHLPSGPSEKRLAEWATVIGGNVPEADRTRDAPDGTDSAS